MKQKARIIYVDKLTQTKLLKNTYNPYEKE